uniref:Small integral membrane protein 43 n=1 Tax=Microcebus murinus TaxID=30608 RepID=A0A8C5USX7_MICMU
MTSNLIRTILMVALISKLGTAVDAERMPSGVIPQNERENLPRVCHALAFLGMTRCQDLFLVHLQGWKLGTSFLSSLQMFAPISLARIVSLATAICKIA